MTPMENSSFPTHAEHEIVTNAAFLAWAQDTAGLVDSEIEQAACADSAVEFVIAMNWIEPSSILSALEPCEEGASCRECDAQYELGKDVIPYSAVVPCPRCGGVLVPSFVEEATAIDLAPHAAIKALGTIGPYTLIARLGEGGMGAVYEAKSDDGTLVALKVLKPSVSDTAGLRRRFEREGRALEQFRHPHVVGLVDRGVDDLDQAYLAMELVRGVDLSQLLKQRRMLPFGEAIYIVRSIALALEAAHERKLLHRDIKPANVLLTDSAEVKVTDFGISLEEDVSRRLTAEGAVLGTPQFIAPEAAILNEWTPAVDIYALGCTAFQIVSGRVPFPYRSILELIDAHQSETPLRLEVLTQGVPSVLGELVSRMLAKDPAARPTAREVQESLGELAPPRADLLGAWGVEEEATISAPVGSGAPSDATIGLPSLEGSLTGSEETLTTGQVFHHYLLKDELGRGGMGVVYRARHIRLKKEVAVKVMLAGALAGEAERGRFLREAEAAASLQHPYVVGVLDSGEWNGNLYLAMDHVTGQPLQDYYKSVAERDSLLATFVKICEGVTHAHRRGVIHRDLKPDNILIDELGNPHILDFGIAKRLDAPEEEVEATLANLTTAGDIMGTLRYMPPEQAEGRANEVDVRSDVYTLGGILYELVTRGGAPFRGNVGQMIYQIVNEDPAPPSLRSPGVPWELDAICLKALSKEADQRYQSAHELAQDVKRYVAGLPIFAKRSTTLYRLGKWLRRNPRRIASAVAAAVSVVFVLAAWAGDRAASERERRSGILRRCLEGWQQAKRGEFKRARQTFGIALSRVETGEALPVPSELGKEVPPRLSAGHVDRVVLDRWRRYAAERLGAEEARELSAKGMLALRAGRSADAERALRAAEGLAPQARSVAALRQEVSTAYLADGQARIRAAMAVVDLDDRESALEAAEGVLRRARDFGAKQAGLDIRSLNRLKIDLESERTQRRALSGSRSHVERAQSLMQEASAPGPRRLQLLRAAGRELTQALGFVPRDPHAQALKTRVHLRLAELALSKEEVALAELALEDARLYGRLRGEVSALSSRVTTLERAKRAFKEETRRGDVAYERGDYEGAHRAYGRALRHRPDADVKRRRRLARLQGQAARARKAESLRREQVALIEVQSLDARDSSVRSRLEEIHSQLVSEAVEAAKRTLEDARRGESSFDVALNRYERVLSLDSQNLEAIEGRRTAAAMRDLPSGRVYVSVRLDQITTGVARSSRVLDFYIDRTEVTCAEFAEFVKIEGYRSRDYWSKAGWSHRRQFRDSTGKPGPANWANGSYPLGTENLPVTGVSYYEAEAYAKWKDSRLPTGREWRLAACFDPQLGHYRLNPWGGATLESQGQLSQVGSNPGDQSPFGALDMGLNASEWVKPKAPPTQADSRAQVRGFSARAFPYELAEGVDRWTKRPRATFRDPSVGFRCCSDVGLEGGLRQGR